MNLPSVDLVVSLVGPDGGKLVTVDVGLQSWSISKLYIPSTLNTDYLLWHN